MADWAKEIMKLANDLCLDTNKTREVVKRGNFGSTTRQKGR